MLEFPNRTGLVGVSTRVDQVCYPPDHSRIINQERAYEIVTVAYSFSPAIALTVQSFNEASLDANLNYSTESRTFASVEFFVDGFYIGYQWLTKERQLVMPSQGSLPGFPFETSDLPTTILARVISGGMIPCLRLIEIQPDPNDPNAIMRTTPWKYYAFLIKPKKDVVIYVEAP